MSLTVDTVRVGLLGFGTVGQSVARILCDGHVPRVELQRIFNRGIAGKRVDWVPSSIQWTENVDDVLMSDVDVIVDLVGGLHPAYEWVRAALMAGTSVVTANKQLIAHYGAELGELARAHGQQLRFEASVAGGIPVLRALQEGLAGDRLVEVRGILNGTCAYILTRMQNAELPFAEALAEAQSAGFAEADPTEDVDGGDAAAKLAIIAAVGLRRPVRVGDITKQSIRPIDIVDFQYAREIGCTIRQIARAAVQGRRSVFAVVGPALVPLNSSYGRIEAARTWSRCGACSVARRRSPATARAGRRRPWQSCPICCRYTARRQTARTWIPWSGVGGGGYGRRSVERLRGTALCSIHRRRPARDPRRHLRGVRAARHQRRSRRPAAPVPEGSAAVRRDDRGVFLVHPETSPVGDHGARFPCRAAARASDPALNHG